MKKAKASLAVLALAICLNAQPILARLSSANKGAAQDAQARATLRVSQPAYGTVLTQGAGFWESLAINPALFGATVVIGVATGGAGAVAAGAAAVV